MSTDSAFYDEIYERLQVLYNHQRLLKSDIEQRTKANVKDLRKIAELEEMASHYEAFFRTPEQEGVTA